MTHQFNCYANTGTIEVTIQPDQQMFVSDPGTGNKCLNYSRNKVKPMITDFKNLK